MARKPESPGDRKRRLTRDAEMKKDHAAANEAEVERMIKRNIEQHGP